MKNAKEFYYNLPIYLRDYYNHLDTLEESSRQVYLNVLMQFITYYEEENSLTVSGIHCFDSINTIFVEEYLKNRCNSSKTRGTVLFKLKKFFDYLKRKNIINTNPCDEADVQRENAYSKRTNINQILTKSEEELLLHHLDKYISDNMDAKDNWGYRDASIICCMLLLGLKSSDVINLKESDIDLKSKIIYSNEREIKFGNNLLHYLANYKRLRNNNVTFFSTPYFFISGQMKQISMGAITKIIEKHSKSIDKKVTPEILRQTCINNVYRITGDLKATADYFGYSNIRNIETLIIPLEYDENLIVNKMDSLIQTNTTNKDAVFIDMLSKPMTDFLVDKTVVENFQTLFKVDNTYGYFAMSLGISSELRRYFDIFNHNMLIFRIKEYLSKNNKIFYADFKNLSLNETEQYIFEYVKLLDSKLSDLSTIVKNNHKF